MSTVVVPHYVAKCEQCSVASLPKATAAAAQLAFHEYLGTSLPDGRNLCRDHEGALQRCSARSYYRGIHIPDPAEPALCLLCGWPVPA